MEVRAYAKINLYLDVIAKRKDGYHNIVSVMQTVDLCDIVKVEYHAQQPGEIVLHCDGGLPCDARNLAFRAALAYFADQIPGRIEIEVQKHIPAEAGLAGGSADCAAVLRALNQMFGKYDAQSLLALGTRLGADVPFCLVGGTQITRGIGEVMQPCAPMPDCFMVIARGGQGVSTPQAYRALDDLYGDFTQQATMSEQRLAAVQNAMEQKDICALSDAMYNIFESVVLPVHDTARELKQIMTSGGAIGALMSGSGPSVVGLFTHEAAACRVCEQIREKGIASHVCRPVN